ncbi:alpha/beta fold hydrolase [Micromonospora sp. WMMD1128]|uniref:alpha/beta hydrolase n=1 Tax=Micromonospora sp. WMMD1128 TaxID=3015150 RepID=UPI00248B0966|nr:alpha/beta fold hydrolase [Micromonospora sp. WMMD1128]WBB74044.1 alpha/beta fold hydrolase [Micromonospora sp. WMMD1128]
MPRAVRSLAATGIAGIVLAGSAVAPAAATPQPPPYDRTSAAEARRVDRVPTPRLDWYACYDYAQCTSVRLPLDYDHPKGATTEVALLRVRARDQQHRIGSLFVNPGGPGVSGTDFALAAPYYLGDDLLDRFDVVGVDPRGAAASENIRCFRSVKDQTRAYAGLNVPFPWTKAEEKAYVAASKRVGRGCSTTGRPLTGAASTAEVARDMEVLRRAVGDRKLSYLGFSYGTALGQYYANMFPDRFRTIAVDGVLDPNAWAGRGQARNQMQETRLRSADGAYRALNEILLRCSQVARSGGCALGDHPAAAFDTVAKRLRVKPLVVGSYTISYADFIGATLNALYYPYGWEDIVELTAELLAATAPGASRAAGATARRALAARAAPGYDFPYDNAQETFLTVACTDAYHPKSADAWPALAAREDQRAPYFGRAWAWTTSPCARDTWTVRDEDAWTGPFNRTTAAPLLVVGDYWDPATNYQGAVGSAALLPNSRLLSSDSWGHTAYGTSACVTSRIDAYLISGALPDEGTVCVGDTQPFADLSTAKRVYASKSELARAGLPGRGEPKRLPPVAGPRPAAGTLTVR